MKQMRWIGLVASLLLVAACFMSWVVIREHNIVISGVDAGPTRYGKPGYFHFLMCAFFIAFLFIPRLWARRLNLLVGALNLSWAIKNFLVISRCEGGDCPEKQWGLYLVLLSSVLMLLAALFSPGPRGKHAPL